ncbi:MAG: hypothetical protein HY823_07655 [Acidobacteria bacterium]|nr:hypothetical protein [Acidobacteriota bacterium]
MDPGSGTPAEQALSLLFGKLHPRLEDAAHALGTGAAPAVLEGLHRRLQRARLQAVAVLERLEEGADPPALADLLGTLAANLTPIGENFQQSLVLTQLCLEEAPRDLLPFAPEGCVAASTWGRRMVTFLARLEDPAFQARQRWTAVDPDLGDEALEEPS